MGLPQYDLDGMRKRPFITILTLLFRMMNNRSEHI